MEDEVAPRTERVDISLDDGTKYLGWIGESVETLIVCDRIEDAKRLRDLNPEEIVKIDYIMRDKPQSFRLPAREAYNVIGKDFIAVGKVLGSFRLTA